MAHGSACATGNPFGIANIEDFGLNNSKMGVVIYL
jgi:hypothetical protein